MKASYPNRVVPNDTLVVANEFDLSGRFSWVLVYSVFKSRIMKTRNYVTLNSCPA